MSLRSSRSRSARCPGTDEHAGKEKEHGDVDGQRVRQVARVEAVAEVKSNATGGERQRHRGKSTCSRMMKISL